MSENTKYKFLELATESQATSRGANLSEKNLHLVLRTIQRLTNTSSAHSRTLFTLDTPITGAMNLRRVEVKNLLRKLIEFQLAVQIYRLEYIGVEGGLKMRPCFLSASEDGKEDMYSLYSIVRQQSVDAIETNLAEMPAPDPEIIKKALLADFNSRSIPSASELSGILFEPFKCIDRSNFDISPPDDLIDVSLREMEQILVDGGRVVYIENYGLLPVHQTGLIDFIGIVDDFVKNKLSPRYRNKGNIKREFEQIQAEESLQKSEPHPKETASFALARSRALRSALVNSSHADSLERFPGSLAVEIIIKLAERAEELYDSKRETTFKEMERNFKKELLTDHGGIEGFRTINHDESFSFPPEVWQLIRNDPQIASGEWQQKNSTEYIFLAADSDVFRRAIKTLDKLSSSETWKILAIDFQLRNNRQANTLREVMKDPGISETYNNLLFLAAESYMPWYYRLLAMFGFRFFRNSAILAVQPGIDLEQERYKTKNQLRYDTEKKKQNAERQAQAARLRELSGIMQMVEVLDHIYFGEQRVPTISDLRRQLPDLEQDKFNEILGVGQFRYVKSSSETDPLKRLVVYPMDHNWRAKKNELTKALTEIRNAAQESDRELANRAAQVLGYISSEDKKGVLSKSEEKGDPYEVFAEELQKHENKEDEY